MLSFMGIAYNFYDDLLVYRLRHHYSIFVWYNLLSVGLGSAAARARAAFQEDVNRGQMAQCTRKGEVKILHWSL